jgi:hypothetical protein
MVVNSDVKVAKLRAINHEQFPVSPVDQFPGAILHAVSVAID